MMKKYNIYLLIQLLSIAFVLSSCGYSLVPDVEENYEKLFPFQGIDKPERDETDAVIRKGDINVTKETFKYPGDDASPQFTRYNITLTYEFTEAAGQPGGRIDSRYVLRFINAKKQLISIGSNPLNGFKAPEEEKEEDGEESENEEDSGDPFEMNSQQTYHHKFDASSGFALYLCVNGHGLRNSRITASLTAVSVDGSVPPITLKVEGIQPNEGTQQLLNPYCEYVILP